MCIILHFSKLCTINTLSHPSGAIFEGFFFRIKLFLTISGIELRFYKCAISFRALVYLPMSL